MIVVALLFMLYGPGTMMAFRIGRLTRRVDALESAAKGPPTCPTCNGAGTAPKEPTP